MMKMCSTMMNDMNPGAMMEKGMRMMQGYKAKANDSKAEQPVETTPEQTSEGKVEDPSSHS